MEDRGFSPAKIAVLGIILALFAGAGYFATRSGSSDSKTQVSSTAAPASNGASTDATTPASADTSAAPAQTADASAGVQASTAAAPAPDQATQAPAQVTPPPQTAMVDSSANAAAPATSAPEPAASSATVPASAPDTPTVSAPAAPSSSNEVAQNDAPAAVAPSSSSKKKTHRSSESENVTSAKPTEPTPPPALSVLTPWWGQNTDAFHVVAVGPASEKSGIVVVFSHDLKDASAAGQQIHLTRDGQPVAGNWQAGTNGRVLALTDLQPGKYQLAIDGDVAATSSQTLGTTRTGVVYVN